MTDVINNIVTDKQDVKNQLTTIPDVVDSLKRFDTFVKPEQLVTKLVETDTTLDNIWGRDNWGTMNWQDSTLPSNDTLFAVIPRNNEFKEYFGQDLFINTTNSTGTISTSAETYDLGVGEILESEVICKIRSPINSVRFLEHDGLVDDNSGMILGSLALGIDTFGSSNVIVEFSNDSGATWFGGATNGTYSFATSTNTDELKYRITATSAVTISAPLILKING